MRDALAILEGQRITVHAVFRRFGHRSPKGGGGGRTMLLRPVVAEDGTLLADHMWIRYGRASEALGLKSGTVLEVRGVVTAYEHPDGQRDYHLRDVRRVRRLAGSALVDPKFESRRLLKVALSQIANAAEIAGGMLEHVHRVAIGKQPDGDWYGSLLTARSKLLAIDAALRDVRRALTQLEQGDDHAATH